MENQHQEYKWVKINTDKIGSIHDRFYIAPNPKNMHKIALGLVEEFTSQNLPVMFKYQLTTSENHCDRIIIYSDKEHNKQVENAIKAVYDKNHELFTGCERSMAWIYDTSVPGVYTTPEKPGTSYGNAFANVVVDAYKTFCYLYGVSTMSTISIPEQEKDEAYQADDINILEMQTSFEDMKLSDGEYFLMNMQVLEILKAYDITKNDNLLQYTKFLTNLLLNHNQNSPIYYINYCQILKREIKLTGENIDKIIDIRNNCDALEIKLGCNLLLDNKTEVNSLLKKIDSQTLEVFKSYPISIYF